MAQSTTQAAARTDGDGHYRVHFALNLECLEAEFYTKTFYGKTIEQMGIAVDGAGNAARRWGPAGRF